MSKWFCVVVFWKTGEIQSIWVKDDWGLAWAIANDVLTREGVEKVQVFPEKTQA